MKRVSFIIILVLALLPMSAFAGNVTPEKASIAAGRFLGTDAVSLEYGSSAQKAQGRDSQPEYYVFNNPDGGWVIIAADDRVTPVLAYSNTGSFQVDDMPENVRYWMDGMAGIIDSVRTADIPSTRKVQELWAAVMNGTGFSESRQVVLETALWGQDSPFNDLCPICVNSSERASAGCVATAMSIVMHYTKWPEHGTGTVGGYRSDTYSQYYPAYSIDDHKYDWASMPFVYDASSTPYARNQVAALMLDCGMAVEMDYTKEGSGAWNFVVAEALRNHFSYQNVQYLDRSSFQPQEWFSIIKNEIDADRVVLYSGQSNDAGHQFVCDGYDPDYSMVHINWGWDGSENGFFALDLNIERYNWAFEYYQSIVIGIAAGNAAVLPVDFQPVSLYGGAGIIIDSSSSLLKDGTVHLNTGWLANFADFNYTSYVKACLMSSNGDTIQQIGLPTLLLLKPNYYSTLDFIDKLQVQPRITDYFQLFITDPHGDWVPLKYDINFCPSGQDVCCGITQDPLILTGDGHVGESVDLKLGYGSIPVISVTWYVNGQEYEGKTLTIRKANTEIRADIIYCDGSTGSISKTLAVE